MQTEVYKKSCSGDSKRQIGSGMEERNEVKLYGAWSSAFSKRVEIALKLKGIPYTYIEENLSNKSQALLHYNPIHKKVPVLVHNGKPILESLVILEYIDEQWDSSPKLLPEDPYERSKVRFWANFYDQHVVPVAGQMFRLDGDKQQEAIKAYFEKLGMIEKYCFGEGFGGKPLFLHGEIPGFLDIVMGSSACSRPAAEEVVGFDLTAPNKHPMFCSWVDTMTKHPLVKESLPSHEKLAGRIKKLRENALNRPSP